MNEPLQLTFLQYNFYSILYYQANEAPRVKQLTASSWLLAGAYYGRPS
jgi:hypothetical protein